MHPSHARRALPKSLLVTGAATALVFASASAAYAATLDTGATLSASISAPSVVNVGDNSFTLSVFANGNLPAGSSTVTGVATVTTKYFMSGNGTITPSTAAADQQTLQFSPGYNYSKCPTTNAPQGCAGNPFSVTADLVVAAGTAGGASGTLKVATAGSQSLDSDSSPATGYVQVAVSNHAPTLPGAPTLDTASTSPNNTGSFTVAWAAATDQDAGDATTYTLQKRDADDADWTTVSSGITTNSYAFSGESEGTWRYRVQAADSHGASSAFAIDDAPIVVVDTSAPNAPTASTSASPAYTDSDGNSWFKDSVTVSFASAGDPALADGSNGSGVASVSSPQTFSSTASFSAAGHATDKATNVSAETGYTGSVDAAAPTVDASCPTGTVLLHATTQVSWTASDTGSGLATSASGSVPLDTSTVGDHTVSLPAAVDNVGHVTQPADCSYHVGYAFGGFLQPINDTAHFVGETTSVFKAGSTVPVKFQLLDANGVPVQASSAPAWLSPAQGSAVPSSTAVDESTYDVPASSGSVFKWDATSQQYVYNYKTDKNQSGHFWRIGLTLDDGSTHVVSIALR